MYLLPAIDLLDGQVVRLKQGAYDQVSVYNDDPLEQARTFAQAGAEHLHVVDLNGARSGQPEHLELIKALVKQSGLQVEVGGGVRSLATLDAYAQAGVARVVLGTQLIRDPGFARAAADRYGDLICAGVDAKDGIVAIAGWEQGSGQPVTEVVGGLTALGIRHLVYTDIVRDGMRSGINATAYADLATLAGFPVTASGGIATIEDIQALAALGSSTVEGIICGRALYEGSLDLSQALECVAHA
jgi:phosphoribosylformimino-5-aminoimidazole carboxamide ribotide isomerase